MKPLEFELFLDYVRRDVAAIGQVGSRMIAVKVIRQLAREGMKVSELLLRCCHFQYGDQLFREVVYYCVEQGRIGDFASALVTMEASWWAESEINPLILFLNQEFGRALFSELLRKHSEVVTNPENPLYSVSGTAVVDLYWAFQVRYYIVNRDYRRAWDELVKARIGALKSHVKREIYKDHAAFINACRSPDNRCWRASPRVVCLLAGEIYEQMSVHGLVSVQLPNKPQDEAVYQVLKKHFNTMRQAKRQARRERALAEYQRNLPTN